MTSIPDSLNFEAVPPVEIISQPIFWRALEKSDTFDLSQTLMSARGCSMLMREWGRLEVSW